MDETLRRLRVAYRQGDRGALLRAVLWCLIPPEKTIPKWARIGLRDAIFNTLIGEKARSWDDVFGKPHPKSAHLDPDRFQTTMEIYAAVKKEIAEGGKMDDETFERVSRKNPHFRKGRSSLKSVFFEVKKHMEGG